MPLTLPPITRRRFLRQTFHATAAAALSGPLFGADDAGRSAIDPDSFALLSDTHVPADPMTKSGTTNMTDNFNNASRQLLALAKAPAPGSASVGKRPAQIFISGDVAFLKGLPEDYASISKLLAPLREAGYPIAMMMGNHDERAAFYDKLLEHTPEHPPVEDKYVSVVKSARANWFLLDSLYKTGVTGGELGEKQIDWLTAALDKHTDKPAIIIGHHNPQWDIKPDTKWFGIKDTELLFERLQARKHVKAYVYGHSHDWHVDEHQGIHLINLPPVAYVFKQGRPNGWTHAQLTDNSIALTLRCHDETHPDHDKTVTLKWREG